MSLFRKLYFAILRLRNSLDFAIRQKVHPHQRPVSQLHTSHRDVLSTYPPDTRDSAKKHINSLNAQYHFEYFSAVHSVEETKENYFYLAMLDAALGQMHSDLPPTLKAADIGPSSWFYVHALASALTWYKSAAPRTFHLTGYEVDAYRLYSDFHTRKDHALGNMLGLANVEFVDRGFSRQPDTFDVITLFFPFVFEKDHLQWGLPGNMFNPALLMKAAWDSLHSNGLMVIVNQGVEEHRAEQILLQSLGIPVSAAFRMDSVLYSYPLDRYILTVQK
jgi:hypothetical protein